MVEQYSPLLTLPKNKLIFCNMNSSLLNPFISNSNLEVVSLDTLAASVSDGYEETAFLFYIIRYITYVLL